MASHSSVLAWEIPWTEELGAPQCMGSPRLGHDLATKPPQRNVTIVKIITLVIVLGLLLVFGL